jgi:hypothetical protein
MPVLHVGPKEAPGLHHAYVEQPDIRSVFTWYRTWKTSIKKQL